MDSVGTDLGRRIEGVRETGKTTCVLSRLKVCSLTLISLRYTAAALVAKRSASVGARTENFMIAWFAGSRIDGKVRRSSEEENGKRDVLVL